MSQHPEYVAWTGGSSPRSYRETLGTPEGAYAVQLYNEQIEQWEATFRERCPAGVCDVFWNRARSDAHATYRAAARDAG